MKNKLAYLKIAIPLVNIGIFLQSMLILFTAGFMGLKMAGQTGSFVQRLMAFIESTGGQVVVTESGIEVDLAEALIGMPIWVLVLAVIDAILALGVLICIRKFLKNIQVGEIFVDQNVRLAKWSAILIFASSFLSVSEMPKSGFSLNMLNFTYLITALLVWTISKVLEQANVIAEENDFTI